MSTHWIDKHFNTPQERAAAILADEDRRHREARGRMLRLFFAWIPLGLVAVALLGAGSAAALNYYGVVDLTAYVPQLPRKAPMVLAPVLNAEPASTEADATLPPDLAKMVLAPPPPMEALESDAVPVPAASRPAGVATSDRARQAVAMLGRELAEVDGGIAGCRSALYVRPWPSEGGRPAPWTDAEHLVELEAYWNRSRLNADQVWQYNRAHDAWSANVRNDQRRLAELTAKRTSIAARQAKAAQ